MPTPSSKRPLLSCWSSAACLATLAGSAASFEVDERPGAALVAHAVGHDGPHAQHRSEAVERAVLTPDALAPRTTMRDLAVPICCLCRNPEQLFEGGSHVPSIGAPTSGGTDPKGP